MFTPTSLHAWHLIDTFVELKGFIKLITHLPRSQLSSESCRDLRVLFNPFLLAAATGLTHLQQLVFSLPGSEHLLCSHSCAVAWILWFGLGFFCVWFVLPPSPSSPR